MDFWMRLKNEIKAKNTTQEWIAGKIGVPLSTFRKWMTRKTYPDIKEGIEIAKLLETSAEYLVTGVKAESLTDTERKLIGNYRKLSPSDRENVILAVKAWAGKKEFRVR
ncbi:MAG: helix-turn-helix domain-containing protein [Clostridiales bacterium]|jgi:transcriptional regulator with XRE-family HTH domain|nr:helix-turn-helix domain-containing protein [Clostridiales bacterium]